jgi:succinoglycan biosynthesis transport protein ExoP
VTTPLVGGRTGFETRTLGAAARRARTRRPPSLLAGRIQRGLHRQWLLFVLVAVAVAAGGVAYDLNGNVRLIPALLLWAPVGLGVGLAVALFRELNRNTVTLVSSLGKHRGYSVYGAAPELTPRALRELAPDQRTPLGAVTFQPASPFASAYRDLQGAVAQDNVVAVISSLAKEGATTAAVCLGVAAVQQGRRVLLVDCDLRRRSATRLLGSKPQYGLIECAETPQMWSTVIEEEPETGLHLLPATPPTNAWRSLIGSPGFRPLLAELRNAYDLVILDCPSALSSAEGALIAALADKAIVVTAWDRTPVTAVRRTVRTLHGHSNVTTGVYINRVPPGYRFGRVRPE